MAKHPIFTMAFAKVYPMYVKKAERKGRSKGEVDHIIRWLTGYDQAALEEQIAKENDFETFFAQAPAMNPDHATFLCTRHLERLVGDLARLPEFPVVLLCQLVHEDPALRR